MSLSSLPDNQAMGPRSELTYVEPHAGRSHGAHERQTDAVVPLPKRTRLATQPTGPLGKDEPNRKRTRWRRAREWTVLPQHSHPSDQMRVPGAYDECAGNDKVRCQREDRLAEERSRPLSGRLASSRSLSPEEEIRGRSDVWIASRIPGTRDDP